MSDSQGYQRRVYSYRLDLLTRLNRLRAFMSSPLFAGVDPDEQTRLHRQATLMEELGVVLQERIEFFSEVNRRIAAGRAEQETNVASTAEVRAALTPDIPLSTIGPIVSTDMHDNTSDYVPSTDETIAFWGRFLYEGDTLRDVPVIDLRKHLLHAMGRPQGHAANIRPAGYIGVVAMKAGE